jgi:type I restriction enzyme S subunit
MIMQDNEKKPALRFKGFTDPWEQRKLGDLCVEFRSGEFISASDITETGEYPVFGGNGLRGFTDRFNHDGEYTLIGRQGALCGNVNFAVGKSYFTEHAIAVRADKKNQTRFLYYLFSTMDLGQYSGQSAQPGLAVGNLVELKSTLPDKQEQEKISGVLTALDTLITLHQRKYEKLVNIKKSMLDKMFPPNGASVPEIRFKGFTDPWEQRKISELAEKTYGGGTPTTSNEAFWNGNIPWIQSSDIVDGKLIGVEPRKYITQTGLNSSATQLVPKNSIAIITRVGVGKLAYMPFSYSTSQDFLSLSKLNTEPFFTVYACYKKLQSELNTVQGTSIKGITKDELLAKTISVPVYSEQKQIGSFFAQLDTLITLHQRKLEKLQNIKKSCLEKMFV